MDNQNNSCTVSIIIPVYNIENYLSRCIQSIQNQTFQDFEIILINDGSKDNSLQICKEFAANDPRIILLTQENKGVSAARNNAIRVAKGQYLTFVDGDDYVDTNFLDTLLQAIEKKNVQLGICGFCEVINEKEKIPYKVVKSQYLDSSNLYKELFLSNHIRGYLCNKIFENDIVRKHNLYLNESLRIREDQDFVFRYLKYVENGYYMNNRTYKYVRRFGSATRPDFSSNTYMEERLCISNEVLNSLDNMGKNLPNDISKIQYYLEAERVNVIKGLLLECMFMKKVPDMYRKYVYELRKNLYIFLSADGYSIKQKAYAIALSISWNLTKQIHAVLHVLNCKNISN